MGVSALVLAIFQAAHAGVSAWTRDPDKQYQNTQWAEDKGYRICQKAGQLAKPYEDNQWMLRRVGKFGWPKEAAKKEWKLMCNMNFDEERNAEYDDYCLFESLVSTW